ncbi:hypothetical protein OF83DRAFT_1087005 [Amylostereum chailletii]|nr:hypothetical protein OF83DRAFT_1087005 [Amylostereum chailletii]
MHTEDQMAYSDPVFRSSAFAGPSRVQTPIIYYPPPPAPTPASNVPLPGVDNSASTISGTENTSHRMPSREPRGSGDQQLNSRQHLGQISDNEAFSPIRSSSRSSRDGDSLFEYDEDIPPGHSLSLLPPDGMLPTTPYGTYSVHNMSRPPSEGGEGGEVLEAHEPELGLSQRAGPRQVQYDVHTVSRATGEVANELQTPEILNAGRESFPSPRRSWASNAYAPGPNSTLTHNPGQLQYRPEVAAAGNSAPSSAISVSERRHVRRQTTREGVRFVLPPRPPPSRPQESESSYQDITGEVTPPSVVGSQHLVVNPPSGSAGHRTTTIVNEVEPGGSMGDIIATETAPVTPVPTPLLLLNYPWLWSSPSVPVTSGFQMNPYPPPFHPSTPQSQPLPRRRSTYPPPRLPGRGSNSSHPSVTGQSPVPSSITSPTPPPSTAVPPVGPSPEPITTYVQPVATPSVSEVQIPDGGGLGRKHDHMIERMVTPLALAKDIARAEP